jgi:hypothetical protein
MGAGPLMGMTMPNSAHWGSAARDLMAFACHVTGYGVGQAFGKARD